MLAKTQRVVQVGRTARKSDDYAAIQHQRWEKRGGRELTRMEKQAQIDSLLADRRSGFLKVGQGMVGPIQLKLRYQGIARTVLLEDPLEPGAELSYDIQDDLGVAYFLNANEAEVKSTLYEGKRVRYSLFRVAAFPKVKKEDEYILRVSTIEHAQDMAKQEIQKQEDSRLLYLLQQAMTNYAANPKHTITPDHVVLETSGMLTDGAFHTAAGLIDEHEIESARVIINNRDFRDLKRWDINTTGWAWKDRIVAGEKITEFGEFVFQKSIQVPKGETWLTPDPEFLGVMPIMYSLDVQENNKVEAFHRGWVMDELLNMLILNARGIAKIEK